jgi:hypothetical protein
MRPQGWLLLVGLAAAVSGWACGDRVSGVSLWVAAAVAPILPTSRDLDGCGVASGWVTISVVEPVPCVSMGQRLWQRWSPLGAAWAHGTSSPTRLAAPHVVSLTDGARLELGRLEPPAGAWCAVHVALGPADADAEGAEGTTMVGKMLELHLDDGRTVTRRDSVSFDLPFESLTLGPSRLDGTVLIRVDAAQWLAATHAVTARLDGLMSGIAEPQ